eukprot:776350-Alexandrium_andersonii.AAC.1
MAVDSAGAGVVAASAPLARGTPSPERTRNTNMPAPLPKAPPPHIFPGLGQTDAAQAARAWHSMGGVAYRV